MAWKHDDKSEKKCSLEHFIDTNISENKWVKPLTTSGTVEQLLCAHMNRLQNEIARCCPT